MSGHPNERSTAQRSAWRAEIERLFRPNQTLVGVGTPELRRLATAAAVRSGRESQSFEDVLLEIASSPDNSISSLSDRTEQRALAIGACAWLYVPAPTAEEFDRFYPPNSNGVRIKFDSSAMRFSWAYYCYRRASLDGARQQSYGRRPGAELRQPFRDALIAAVDRHLASLPEESAVASVAEADRATEAARTTGVAALISRLAGLHVRSRGWLKANRSYALALAGLSMAAILAFTIASWPRDLDPGEGSGEEAPSEVLPADTPNAAGDYWEASWGPEREMFTIDQEGSPYPAFNSISDNPDLGDERNFVGLRRETSANVPNVWSDDVWAELGDTFIMRVYVNNAGADASGGVSAGRLQGVRLQVGMSTGTREVSVYGVLSAVNATTVWDGATIHLEDGAAVVFEPEHALLENNAHPDGGLQLGAEAFSSEGVQLGYEDMDGVIKPGYQYAAYVTYRLSVVEAERALPPASDTLGYWGPERETFTIASGGAPYPIFNSITDNPNYGDERNFLTIKSEEHRGAGGWGDDVWANPGETFYVRVYAENSGQDSAGAVAAGALQDSRVRLSVESSPGEHVIRAELSAVNAITVWDSAIVHTRPGVVLDFDAESSELLNNIFTDGVALENDPFAEPGALIGFESLDGVVLPGYRYDMFIIVKVTARAA